MWICHTDQDGRMFYESATGVRVWADSLLDGPPGRIIEWLRLSHVHIVSRDGGPSLVDASGDEWPLTPDGLPGDRARVALQLAAVETYVSLGPRFCGLCGESLRRV